MINRKPIFQAIKALLRARSVSDGFSSAEVRAIDAGIDEAVGMTVLVVPAPSGVDAFPAALKELLKHEGGYVNHKADPGGRTNLGVTQRVREAWTGKRANESIMRALTPAMVAPLYRKNYWNMVRADELPGGLALTVFDFGVNAGPGRAIKLLQRMIGANEDGAIGPLTIAGVKKYVATHGEAAAILAYSDLRRGYYRSLRTFAVFGKGWMRRVNEVADAALALV